MLENIFDSASSVIDAPLQILICTLASAGAGFIIALCYMFRTKYTRSFVTSLVILPIIVQAVIMLVNGNLGTGVAVMGAFSLVRFRSAPGTSREIAAIFLAMAAGLAAGTGHVGFALALAVFVGLLTVLLTAVGFGEESGKVSALKIIIPEDMDFENAFDDILDKYTSSYRLMSAKTVNMGSLYELKYDITLKKSAHIKEMIDEIRCRNGNLTVVCGRRQSVQEEL